LSKSGSPKLVIASRGSRLALRQAEIVSALIRSKHSDVVVDTRVVSTSGDKDARPFGAIGAKGLFTAEIEREVVEGRADVAVHSAKDLTAELAEGCAVLCVPTRASVHDVVVGPSRGTGEERIGSLPAGATVGTSSMRRRTLVAEARPDVDIVDFRGNLDTRLDKVEAGRVDAAILAAAGIHRLMPNQPMTDGLLDPGWWVPAPGQGALAVEGLTDRAELAELFEGLSDGPSVAEVRCERAFAITLEGGCSIPLGCWARASGNALVVTGYLGAPDGSHAIRETISGPIDDPEGLGRTLAEAVLASGGSDVLADLRAATLSAPAEP
jgi:hydroxymethylbilane synthase